MFNSFKRALFVMWVLTVRFVDWLTIKESPWDFIGDGHIVFQKEVTRGDLQFLAKVFVDWATMGMRHGTFGIRYRNGCIPSKNGLFFYPALDRETLALEMMACGIDRFAAEQSAREEVERHHQLALSFGDSWWLYGIELTATSAKTGDTVNLTKSGISVVLNVLDMDPEIVRGFDQLATEAELLLEGTVGQPSYTQDASLFV